MMQHQTSHAIMKSRIRQVIVLSLLLGSAAGLFVGGIMMSIAWNHNPQMAFHEPGNIHWQDWLMLGFLWFIPACCGVAMLSSAIGIGGMLLVRHLQRGGM